MSLIEWREEYRLGVPAIDYEHETLIQLLNDLHAGIANDRDVVEVSRFLGEVHAKISAHFALEERLMRERGYDQYDEHKADHERLLDEIRDIMDEVEARADYLYEEELSRRLAAWFSVHFRTHDARLHNRLG
jgi:hemerythrin-like metal-binding protein